MGDSNGPSNADRNFLLQQGVTCPPAATEARLAAALLFQPWIVGALALVGTLSQRPEVFVFLAVLLWWSALVPRWNPFEFVYRATLGRSAGAPELPPAPPPRRFAQGMAGSFALGIALFLLGGQWQLAWLMEGVLLAAIAALLFGRFCLGSFVYHLLRGQWGFAMRTLPWRRGA